MLCKDCGHETQMLKCPCDRMEFLYEHDGKKYFKKLCGECNKQIFSKNAKGLNPNDFQYDLCNPCQYKLRIKAGYI